MYISHISFIMLSINDLFILIKYILFYINQQCTYYFTDQKCMDLNNLDENDQTFIEGSNLCI